MRIFTFLLVFFGLTLSACSAPDAQPKAELKTQASDVLKTKAWNLRGNESQLEFISVKKGTIVETHSFTDLSGRVLPGGGAVILIKLDSVETNIDIRNERMKKYLFETDKLVSIMIKAQLDISAYAFMSVGERKNIEIPVSISMHGNNDVMDIAMAVTRLGENKVVVESRTPVIIDTDTFGYGDGILKLQELANLNIIAPEVPVMFSLVFER